MDYRIAVAFLGLLMVTSGCVSSLSDDAEPSEVNSSPDPGVDLNGSQEDTEDSSDTEVDRTVEVAGGSFYFEPDNIEVEQGDTIEFTLVNEGGQHDLRIPDLGAGTSVISGGETESFTVTFEETGEYRFICSVGTHAQRGMTGTITVS